MKIFCHVPRESWIVDRMGSEYLKYSSHDVSLNSINDDTDIIWLFASWCWNHIPLKILENKTVVCTIHHEVPEKFDNKRRKNFLARDKFVNFYHTYTEETADLIKAISKKPVKIIPHWVNNNLWKQKDKIEARKKFSLPQNKFLIGSFQRDTEGHDLKTPKLEKGPDIFIEKVKDICKFKKDVHVLLSGWRRQYVINELEKISVKYTYIELPDNDTINFLYNALDLYIVSSRCEGGPQAIFECSALKVPIIATKVGQSFLLSSDCIYDHKKELSKEFIDISLLATGYNFTNISCLFIEKHVKIYDNYFKEVS